MERLKEAATFLQGRMSDESVDDFEIYAHSRDVLEMECKDQAVESFMRSHSEGIALRVIMDDRLGMSTTSNPSRDSLERLIKEACAGAQESGVLENLMFPSPRSGIATLAERPGRPLAEISDDEKIALTKRLERATLAADPRVIKARQPRYRELCVRALVKNSKDMDEEAHRALVFCDVQAVAERDGVSETASEMAHHIRFEELDEEEVGRCAGMRAVSLLGAQSLLTGRYTVCFEPRAAASLLRILMPAFFADNVQKRKSPLVGKRGATVFSSSLSIIDDGVLPRGVGSFLFDGEGVLHQRTTLVEQGCVGGWLYDGSSAMRDGVCSTGNASRRSIHDAPQIAITNAFISDGSRNLTQLMKECHAGLMVSELLGIHTANTITGDFSLGAVGYRLEGGERAEPIRGIVIAGNVIDLFRNTRGVGDDLAFFGQLGAPSVVVEGVQVDGDE